MQDENNKPNTEAEALRVASQAIEVALMVLRRPIARAPEPNGGPVLVMRKEA